MSSSHPLLSEAVRKEREETDLETGEPNTVNEKQSGNVSLKNEAGVQSSHITARDTEQREQRDISASSTVMRGTAVSEEDSTELAVGGSAATGPVERNSESRAGDEEQDIWRQIEALNSPCHVKFSCSITSIAGRGECVLSPKKRARLASETHKEEGEEEEEEEEEGRKSVLVEFEWISGDSRDLLHQIVQYLKNTILKH